MRSIPRLIVAPVAAAGVLLAHATWIAPVSPVLEKGRSATVQIGNGHHFPDSESAIGPDGLEAFVVNPGGARAKLGLSAAGKALSADYMVREAGTYRFVFVQDRGVISRTPTGLKPGGKDKNPGATQSMKSYRSAVAYATTAGARENDAKAVGLEFELVPVRSAGAVRITLLWKGKPCADATVNTYWPGKGEQKLGMTDANGTFLYSIPAGAAGQFLLTASYSEKAAPGAVYDALSYSTALYLSWKQ